MQSKDGDYDDDYYYNDDNDDDAHHIFFFFTGNITFLSPTPIRPKIEAIWTLNFSSAPFGKMKSEEFIFCWQLWKGWIKNWTSSADASSVHITSTPIYFFMTFKSLNQT